MKCPFKKRSLWLAALLVGAAALHAGAGWAKPVVRVGSKHFTEGYVLAELMAQLLEARGFTVRRYHGLGGTTVCFRALAHGEIDLYPEYTGTLEQEILKSEARLGWEELGVETARRFGVAVLPSFGFNNTYALAMTRERARALGVSRISDLARRPELKAGFSYEFLGRRDGWPALAARYGLSIRAVGLEHGLAYQALQGGQVDLTDAYTTDAKIERYGLALLEDDLGFFPSYHAVPVVREEVSEELAPALAPLAGALDEAGIRRLNARVELEGVPFRQAAREFLKERGLVAGAAGSAWAGLGRRLLRRTGEHLWLTAAALALAVAIAVPLGVVSHWMPPVAAAVIPATGLLQTVPSIALLALLIPLFGIGKLPAILALFLYGLLPILRNTYTGLKHVDPQYRLTAEALGLTPWQRLRIVELPMSFPVFLAGVKTAAVINIGTATLAAFIGAGGLGEPIVTGLALNDTGLILEGALPAAGLALATELSFRWVEGRGWAEG